jgi:hypothetical protein
MALLNHLEVLELRFSQSNRTLSFFDHLLAYFKLFPVDLISFKMLSFTKDHCRSFGFLLEALSSRNLRNSDFRLFLRRRAVDIINISPWIISVALTIGLRRSSRIKRIRSESFWLRLSINSFLSLRIHIHWSLFRLPIKIHAHVLGTGVDRLRIFGSQEVCARDIAGGNDWFIIIPCFIACSFYFNFKSVIFIFRCLSNATGLSRSFNGVFNRGFMILVLGIFFLDRSLELRLVSVLILLLNFRVLNSKLLRAVPH